MSTIQDKKPVWPGMTGDSLTSKYEKCRNITEEIYKRINITFQIKSLETASQSDVSDHYSDNVEIDSNELSNGTDLFAYEKSDTITSSEHEEPQDRLTNLNNNEIKKSVVPIYKPPRKRFRKKVKKRSQPHSKPHERDSSASSDEALPLSRVADTAVPKTAATVPKITILTSPHEDPKIKPPPDPLRQSGTPVSRTSTTPASRTSTTPAIRTSTTPASRTSTTPASRTSTTPAIRTNTTPASRTSSTPASRTSSTPASRTSSKSRLSATTDTALSVITPNVHEVKECTVVLRQAPGAAVVPPRGEGGGEGGEEGVRCSMCSMSFKAQRGLRRHVALSHILIPEAITRPKTRQQERGEKAA